MSGYDLVTATTAELERKVEKQTLFRHVLEQVGTQISANTAIDVVEATLRVLFDAEQVNAVRCPACRTRIATVADLEAPVKEWPDA